MRLVILVALVLVGACDSGECVRGDVTYKDGERWLENCHACECHSGTPACTAQRCADECAPLGDCPASAPCAAICCPAGEYCSNVTGECTCGGGPSCGLGDTCEGPNPMGASCGAACCGASGPCPQ